MWTDDELPMDADAVLETALAEVEDDLEELDLSAFDEPGGLAIR